MPAVRDADSKIGWRILAVVDEGLITIGEAGAMSLLNVSRAFPVIAALSQTVAAARAADWPPPDPGEEGTAVAFTPAWAMTQRDGRDFTALQRTAGARGRIVSVVLGGDAPRVVFAWSGPHGGGAMRVFLYADGAFAATITPAAGAAIVLNSFGAFVCPGCTPPVNACGHRPSWVPHEVHWDTFDCGHTLTGPQSLADRGD